MPIAPQFKYENENAFIQQFIIPMLHRLGFSMTVNYHGSREFGRDLIFAEFDRFGHIRYHALQAKYVPSISVNDSTGLIDDCILAFTNPFQHPQTGAREFVSTFYAVNGGSFAEGAVTTFFNAIVPRYGSNARLIEGKDLVSLDRWASINAGRSIGAVLTGMLLEIRSNAQVAHEVYLGMKSYVDQKTPMPAARLRNIAAANYLQQPLLPLVIPTELVECYWRTAQMFNYICDSLDIVVYSGDWKKERVSGLETVAPQVLSFGAELTKYVNNAAVVLTPLIPL